MRVLALRAGQRGPLAAIMPLSVDGMILVATLALGDGRRHRWSAWLAFLVGVSASLSANVIVADHNWTSRAVSAWPAVALLLTVEVLARSGRAGSAVETVSTTVSTVPTEVTPARPAGTLTQQMAAAFHAAVAAGHVPDHKKLAEVTGADRSHARRVHRRLVAALEAVA